MPRGTCEKCGQHDAFLYAVPLTLGMSFFLCTRCLTLPHEWSDDENDEIANGLSVWQFSQRQLSDIG